MLQFNRQVEFEASSLTYAYLLLSVSHKYDDRDR